MQNKHDYKDKYENIKEEFETFSYVVSHDLGAPMRHIREFSKILSNELDNSLTPDQKELLSFIEKGVSESHSMLEALLQYSRLNTQKEALTPVNSLDLINYALMQHKDLISSCKAKISPPKQHYQIMGYNEKLKRLTCYLLENAIKFRNKNKSPNISFDIKENKENFILSIKDNGIGIKEKFRKDIFKIFKQLDPETEGIGIGLTLTKKIAKQHGGDIWVESKPDKGSIFYVQISKDII